MMKPSTSNSKSSLQFKTVDEVLHSEDDIIGGHYCPTALLGSGAFSLVLAAVEQKTQDPVAIKVIQSSFSPVGQQEVNIMQTIASLPHYDISRIVRFQESFVHDGHVCLVFERLSTPVSSMKMNFNSWKRALHDTLCGLAFLHCNQFVHADLKPENILADGHGGFKIADLGNSFPLSQKHLYFDDFDLQTPAYRAPEILHRSRDFGVKVDVWSAGIVFLNLLKRHDLVTFPPDIAHVDSSLHMPSVLSRLLVGSEWDLLKSLFHGLLCADPASRHSSSQAVFHPFFRELNPYVSFLCTAPILPDIPKDDAELLPEDAPSVLDAEPPPKKAKLLEEYGIRLNPNTTTVISTRLYSTDELSNSFQSEVSSQLVHDAEHLSQELQLM
eukprot:ANDGO_04539.mRNA.1 Cyclin-dependent kinase D-2